MDKRLYRSRHNRVIAGVCGGLADYFGIDPVIIRVIFVLLIFAKALGALLYIVLWFLVPEESVAGEGAETAQAAGEEPKKSTEKAVPHHEPMVIPEKASITGGLVLVVLGVIFLIQNFVPDFDFGRLWPLLLLAFGVGMLWNASRKE